MPYIKAKNITVALDEWRLKDGWGLADALSTAEAFQEIFRHTDIFKMTAYTSTTAPSCLLYDGTHAALQPMGLVLKLFSDHYGSIPVAVTGNSPQHEVKGTAGVDKPFVSSGSATYPLDVSASLSADKKKLIVWVEIDRCMTDAISAVTGVRLGKRSLKYVDYGKVAATFVNTETNRAVRIVALESSRTLADERYSDIADKRTRQFRTYSEATDDELFKTELVSLELSEFDLPGSPRSRVTCAICEEGINDGREVIDANGDAICRGCQNGTYYSKLDNPTA